MSNEQTFIQVKDLRESLAKIDIKSIENEAIKRLIQFLEEQALKLAGRAQELAEHASREVINKKDVILAKKLMEGN